MVTISRLATDVTITGFEATDRIVINGLGGDDIIEATGLGNAMRLVANGGDGDNVLIGSAGNDTLTGGNGDNVLIGGGGVDTLDGGPGDNVVIPGAIVGLAMPSMQFIASGTSGGDVFARGQANDPGAGGVGNVSLSGLSGNGTIHDLLHGVNNGPTGQGFPPDGMAGLSGIAQQAFDVAGAGMTMFQNIHSSMDGSPAFVFS